MGTREHGNQPLVFAPLCGTAILEIGKLAQQELMPAEYSRIIISESAIPYFLHTHAHILCIDILLQFIQVAMYTYIQIFTII